ncbi:hypothetical protein FRC20_008037 [Serendipita sp. 405]|nr:hypothetical protein FRC20_008037 [Serendipita sp. 405]
MATIESPTRKTLANVTNTPRLAVNHSKKRTRRHTEEHDALLDLHETSKKSAPLEKPISNPPDSHRTVSAGPSPRGCHRRLGHPGRATLSVLSTRRCAARPLLESFVSSQTMDVHQFRNDDNEASSILSCAYSNGSNRGKETQLAVGTGRGKIEIIDTSERDSCESTPSRWSIQAYDGPIFDLQWNKDDVTLAAACESTLGLIDISTQALTGRFDAHTAAIKSIVWDPNDPAIISSGGRDGNIYVWDIRLHSGAYDAKVSPAMTIKQAHNPTFRKKRNVPEKPPGDAASSSAAIDV